MAQDKKPNTLGRVLATHALLFDKYPETSQLTTICNLIRYDFEGASFNRLNKQQVLEEEEKQVDLSIVEESGTTVKLVCNSKVEGTVQIFKELPRDDATFVVDYAQLAECKDCSEASLSYPLNVDEYGIVLRCIVQNMAETTKRVYQASTQLIVTFGATSLSMIESFSDSVEPDTEVSLKCQSSPVTAQPNIWWTDRDGNKINCPEFKKCSIAQTSEADPDHADFNIITSTLSFTADTFDSGKFTCLTDGGIKAQSELKVNLPPAPAAPSELQMVSHFPMGYVEAGKEVSVECKTDQTAEDTKISWTKNGLPFTCQDLPTCSIDAKWEERGYVASSSLKFKAYETDSGKYACVVTGLNGKELVQESELSVMNELDLKVYCNPDQIKEGGSKKITCGDENLDEGSASLKFMWSITASGSSEQVNIGESDSLYLAGVNDEKIGLYTCTVTSEGYSGEAYFRLQASGDGTYYIGPCTGPPQQAENLSNEVGINGGTKKACGTAVIFCVFVWLLYLFSGD